MILRSLPRTSLKFSTWQANEGRGKHREGFGKDPELDLLMKSFDDLRDVTERRMRERGKRPRR